MTQALITFFVALFLMTVLVLLFRFERARGLRIFAFVRDHLDYWLLKVAHSFLKFYRSTWKNVMRQVVRYLYHTLLQSILKFLERGEQWVKSLMRSNRTSARKSERERATRNKLEEIALHKMEVALSEEEKRRHKERSLHG